MVAALVAALVFAANIIKTFNERTPKMTPNKLALRYHGDYGFNQTPTYDKPPHPYEGKEDFGCDFSDGAGNGQGNGEGCGEGDGEGEDYESGWGDGCGCTMDADDPKWHLYHSYGDGYGNGFNSIDSDGYGDGDGYGCGDNDGSYIGGSVDYGQDTYTTCNTVPH